MSSTHYIGTCADSVNPALLFSRQPQRPPLAARPSIPPRGDGGTGERNRPAAPAPRWNLDHLFSLYVLGDSMLPDFKPGTLIVVDRTLAPEPGDFVIAEGHGTALLRQLVEIDGERWLKPLNDAYPIRPLEGFRIVGVVDRLDRIAHLLAVACDTRMISAPNGDVQEDLRATSKALYRIVQEQKS